MAEIKVGEDRTFEFLKMGYGITYGRDNWYEEDPKIAYRFMEELELELRGTLEAFRGFDKKDLEGQYKNRERWETARLELAWLRGDGEEVDSILKEESFVIIMKLVDEYRAAILEHTDSKRS